jgi:hypothetical protein
MSGVISGVQARITGKYPHAKYFTHCANHRLNLVIVSTCSSVTVVNNFMDNLQHLCSFLSGSAKRKAIVRKHFKLSHSADELFADLHENDQLVANSGRQSLSVLCTTRWLSRVDSVSTLLLNYSAVEESLHEISETSTGQAQRDAESYIRLVKDFTFMFAAVTCAYLLGSLRPLTIALQSHQRDLLKAHNDARDVIETVKSVRTD